MKRHWMPQIEKRNPWVWVKPVTMLITFVLIISLMAIIFSHDLGLFSYFSAKILTYMNYAVLISFFFFLWSFSEDEIGEWYSVDAEG